MLRLPHLRQRSLPFANSTEQIPFEGTSEPSGVPVPIGQKGARTSWQRLVLQEVLGSVRRHQDLAKGRDQLEVVSPDGVPCALHQLPASLLLLGVAASELTDRIVPLEDVWGRAGRELCGELLAARSRADVMDRVARALALRAGQPFETASGQDQSRWMGVHPGGGEADRGLGEEALQAEAAPSWGKNPSEPDAATPHKELLKWYRPVRAIVTAGGWPAT
ncbi:hypothetical protein ACMHYB_01710 [Sorangium sp. So ce1128]